MAQGIYAIRHTASGKVYVGSTKNLTRRQKEHFRLLERGCHRNPHLQGAYQKHGSAAFVWEVLELVNRAEALLEREQVWLDALHAAERAHGYNLVPTAGSNRGWKQSPETIERRAAALRGKRRTLSPEALERLVHMNKTRPRSPEEREANRANMLQDRDTPEYRAKLSEGRKGKRHTPEAIARMSEAHKGRVKTPEELAKISAALKGRPKSPETRERMRLAAQQRVLTAKRPSTTPEECP